MERLKSMTSSDVNKMNKSTLLDLVKSIRRDSLETENASSTPRTEEAEDDSNTNGDDVLTISKFRIILRQELDTKLSALQETITSLMKKNESLEELVVKQQIQIENLERENRAKNIIVSGIPEGDLRVVDENGITTTIKDDLNKVLHVLTLTGPAFSPDKLKKVQRLGKLKSGQDQTQRPRLLKVKMDSVDSLYPILASTKDFRNRPELKGIYINQDRPPLTRKEDKRLRDALRAKRAEFPNSKIFIKSGKLFVDNTAVDQHDLRNQLF